MSDQPSGDKPAILQETEFVVEEGILHRVFRTGAIWLNKLFFSAAFLWIVWLLIGSTQGYSDCTEGLPPINGTDNRTDLPIVTEGTCSVFLTPTSKYLGAMTILAFAASIASGLLGLIVGKRVIETTRAEDEVGAEEREAEKP